MKHLQEPIFFYLHDSHVICHGSLSGMVRIALISNLSQILLCSPHHQEMG